MELVCTYPHHYGYQAGEMFIIYLKGYRREKIADNYDISSSIMFAQIHGHLQIDRKWLPNANKLSTLIEEDEDRVLLDKPGQLPANPSGIDANTTCFLASAKVTLSPSHLESTGMIIESFLPATAISTCRGRSLSVHYYLSIYTQSSAGTSVVHYPIHVYGKGHAQTPYKRMYVGIVAYPLTILPIESFYESDPVPKLCTQPAHMNTLSQPHTHTHTIYKVRDTQHICNVHIHDNHLCMGQKFSLHLDFTHNEQRCEAVRMSLVMQEVFDSVHTIQEKVVVSSMHYTDDAESIHIHMPIPTDICPSTQTLLFEIKYALLLEYYLDQAPLQPQQPVVSQSADTSHPPALPPACSFSLPLSLHAPRLRGTHDDIEGMTKNDWVLMCLHSDITRKPIGDPQLVTR